MSNLNRIGTRISEKEFGRRFREDRQNYAYIFFKADWKYAVAPGVKHQIIQTSSGFDSGIAISRNGCVDFRQFPQEVVYGRSGDRAFIYALRTENTVVVE